MAQRACELGSAAACLQGQVGKSEGHACNAGTRSTVFSATAESLELTTENVEAVLDEVSMHSHCLL